MVLDLVKERDLWHYLKALDHLAIAFSGGVDSTYLLAVAAEALPDKVLAVTMNSSLQMQNEIAFSKTFCDKHGIKHLIINQSLLDLSNVRSNTPERCYHCKKAIFNTIKQKVAEYGFDYVADGTNLDDFSDYRPGLKACDELGILHPLVKAHMYKSDIRYYSKLRGLTTASKPAFACLASRIPYGTPLSETNLKQVALAEEFLESHHFKQYRVRHHGDIARIELLKEDFNRLGATDLRETLVAAFKQIGFVYVTLDLTGYRQGSLNAKVEEKNE